MSSALLLIDFDRTLFDTDRFTAACWQAIEHLFGASAASALEHVERFYVVNGEYQYYDFKAHIAAMVNAPAEKVLEDIRPIVSKQDFVYKDADCVLDWTKDYQVSILTYGQTWHQLYKISFAPQFKDLPVFVALEPKGAYITKHFAGQHGWLVDDKYNGGLPASFTEIHLVRDMVPDAGGVHAPTVHTLMAVNDFLGAKQLIVGA